MDGRRLRRWLFCGGVLAAVGCTRSNQPDITMPKAVLPVPGMTASKPVWGGGQPPGGPVPGLTAAGGPPVVESVAHKKPGSGFAPDAEVAFADTRVESALADPPPTNRDQLLDAARQGYQKALTKDPKNKGALLGLARLNARLGDKDKAMDFYRKYMGLYPKDHEVAHEIAVTHGRWKDWPGAASWCEAAIKLDPENRTYRKTMGFCLARAGKWEEGFAVLCQVMPEAQARFCMARVLEHLNYPDASRQQLTMALQADPTFADARAFLAELDTIKAGGQPGVPTAPANPVMPAGYSQP